MKKTFATIFTTMLLIFASANAKSLEGSMFPPLVVAALKDGATSWSIEKSKGKVVLVDFWASYCEPCKAEMPALNKIYKKYKSQGLEIVGINMDEDKKDAAAFLKQHPVTFPLYFDGKDQKLAKKLDLQVMPTSYLVDRQGKIHHVHREFRAGDEKKIEEMIKTVLKSGAK